MGMVLLEQECSKDAHTFSCKRKRGLKVVGFLAELRHVKSYLMYSLAVAILYYYMSNIFNIVTKSSYLSVPLDT